MYFSFKYSWKQNIVLIHGSTFQIFATSLTFVTSFKDCMNNGRELGVAMLFLVDGASTLVVDTVAGYGVGLLKSYTVVFQAMGLCAVFGGLVMILCEMLHRKHMKRYDYSLIWWKKANL